MFYHLLPKKGVNFKKIGHLEDEIVGEFKRNGS